MQIAIQYVNPAKTGKKFGNVKTPDGAVYWVAKEMEGRMSAGGTYDVEVEDQTWGANAVKVVKSVKGATAALNHGTGQAQQSASTYAPKPNNDRGIFVTGVVGRAMGSGNFGPGDVDALTKAAKSAFDANMGAA